MFVQSGICRTKNIDGVENISPDLWVIAVVLSVFSFLILTQSPDSDDVRV